jgi:hypothetical protein
MTAKIEEGVSVPTWAKLRVLHIISSNPGVTWYQIRDHGADMPEQVTLDAIMELITQRSIVGEIWGPDGIRHYSVTDYGKTQITEPSMAAWTFWTLVVIAMVVVSAVAQQYL